MNVTPCLRHQLRRGLLQQHQRSHSSSPLTWRRDDAWGSSASSLLLRRDNGPDHRTKLLVEPTLTNGRGCRCCTNSRSLSSTSGRDFHINGCPSNSIPSVDKLRLNLDSTSSSLNQSVHHLSQDGRPYSAAAAAAVVSDQGANINANASGSGGAKSQFRPPHPGMTPIELYYQRLDEGELHEDKQQLSLIRNLDRLHDQLRSYEAHPPHSDSMDTFLK